MARAKQEQQELEQRIHSLRHEAGVRAVYEWLRLRADESNRKWPITTGEALMQLQGEARCIGRFIRLIENGPAIKIMHDGDNDGTSIT